MLNLTHFCFRRANMETKYDTKQHIQYHKTTFACLHITVKFIDKSVVIPPNIRTYVRISSKWFLALRRQLVHPAVNSREIWLQCVGSRPVSGCIQFVVENHQSQRQEEPEHGLRQGDPLSSDTLRTNSERRYVGPISLVPITLSKNTGSWNC